MKAALSNTVTVPNGAVTADISRFHQLDTAQCLNIYFIRAYSTFRKLLLILFSGDWLLADISDFKPNKDTKIYN